MSRPNTSDIGRAMRQLVLLFLLLLAADTASAQVFKCVGNDGKVTYTDQPCPRDTTYRPVEILPGPTLSPMEQFRFAANAAGMTDGQYAARLPRPVNGAWRFPRYASHETIVRCRARDGTHFFARRDCLGHVQDGVAFVVNRDAPRQSSQSSTRTILVQTPNPPPARNTACANAKARGQEARRRNLHLSYEMRSWYDRQVWDACHR